MHFARNFVHIFMRIVQTEISTVLVLEYNNNKPLA